MTPDEFRHYGRTVVDWIADYMEQVESLPVLSQVKPRQILGSLPARPPIEGESIETILSDVDSLIMPGITHWQSPNFFAFFPANNSGPSILAEMLSAGLGVQGMLWATSPACTELETVVTDWVAQMLDLPDKFRAKAAGGGVIQDSASSATLCAILAARERATNFQVNAKGINGKLVAYASSQGHSSIEKGIKIAGIGRENLRLIEVDDRFAMRPDVLAEQIERDKQAGLTPFFVAANVGSTSSAAMDPLPEIGRICRERGLWLHVDAAMYGTAAICPEFRFIHEGLDLADSYTFNPHKWMFTNFDCNCFFVADREVLINTLSIMPEYLRNEATSTGDVFDYRDWQIPLGRRFRSLKLWFVIRHYGIEGLRYHIRRHVELAQQFVEWVEESDSFELSTEPMLNLVCFHHTGGDAINQAIMDQLNAGGELYLTHTKLNGRLVLRFCVGQTHTEMPHIERAWQQIQAVAA
ncbi:MAG: aspartate aminotransferase family protein [Anaerolineae bacterium]|nr:aspartate aminotransferase family protein [Anaerolineae bacterium]